MLAAYNGEKYIAAQIESILKQSYLNWLLYIRDDGSTDNTLQIAKQFEQRDERIKLIQNNNTNKGSVSNFFSLLNIVKEKADYIMFADQDDVWQPDKIASTLNEMQSAEQGDSALSPILVYTNFSYVDEDLTTIATKKNYNATKVESLQFSHLLAQNPVYGCTTMINKPLANHINTLPSVAENFDYWIVLVASAFGKIFYLDKKTVLYRQHATNVSGNHDNDSFAKRFKRIFLNAKNLEDVRAKIDMSIAFRNIYYNELSKKNKTVLNDFIQLGRQKNLSLLKKNISNGVRRQTLVQSILFYLSILFLKNSETKIENRP